MNIDDIKLGETYQYYFSAKDGSLQHRPVQVIAIGGGKVTVKEASGQKMTIGPADIDNRQVEAF